MKTHWSLLSLDIIGFASVIETPTLPRVLAPVFRERAEADSVLLPPFSVVGDEVFNCTPSNMQEFEVLVGQGKLTRLPHVIPGKTNYDLWVNAEGVVAYNAKAAVKKALEGIFTERLKLAEEKFAKQDYAAAGHHASVARAVKPSHLDPLVIRAAAERLLGLHAQVAFTRDIASAYISPAEFDQLVKARTGGESTAEAKAARVMVGIAVVKSRFAVPA
ncbi:MAG: hypothetical protein NTV08_15745 [Verrucomicrobia bacterium]|nr:hypothetical protein [Verrucomicrobiota bacterium]